MLRQGGGGLVLSDGGRRKRRRTHPKCLQCPLLGVKVIKCWFGENVKVLASHFEVQKHAPFHLIPPKAPAVSSCSYLFYFFPFLFQIFQILHHHQILGKTHDLLQCFCFFVSFFCMCIFASRFVIKSPGCHDNKLGCHAGISPSSYPHVNDHFTAIPIPDFTGNVVNCGK